MTRMDQVNTGKVQVAGDADAGTINIEEMVEDMLKEMVVDMVEGIVEEMVVEMVKMEDMMELEEMAEEIV